jgi:hypothetical protein
VRGAATVILAMGDGKRAVKAINAYLAGVWPPQDDPTAADAASDRTAEPARA